MNRLLLFGGLLAASGIFWGAKSNGVPEAFRGATGSLASTGGEAEEAAPIGSLALAHRYFQRVDADGTIRPDAMLTAIKQREELVKRQGEGIASPAWTYYGPNNVGGRIRAIVAHPTVSGTLYLASVGGGLWKTTNSGGSWAPMNEALASLCFGALVIDKNNPSVLYAGSGESYFDTSFGENNKAAIQGAGVFKTTDGGATWLQLASTANPDFNCVSRLAMSPTDSLVLLATTNTGIFRTTDGGSTWTKVYNGMAYDVDFHPTDGQRAVAGLPGGVGVVTSADGGATWANSSGIATNVRCETAWSKSVTGNVYAAVCNANRIRVFKSTDFGQTWVLKTSGTGISNYDAYNCAFWVDPTNDNNVILGGVSCSRSTNQGVSFTSAFTSVHADFHAIVEEPGFDGVTKRRVWIGTDGGISTAANVYANTTSDLNNSLGITQFYGGAVNDSTGRIVAGAQDNYTQVFSGSLNWTGVIGGDGVFCCNDPAFPSTFYAGYYYMNIFRSSDGGASFPTDATSGITDRGTNVNCNFVPYIMLDPNQSNTMLACCRRLWRSTNVRTGGTPTWTAIKPAIAMDPPNGGPSREQVRTDHFAPEMPYNLSFCAVAKGNADVVWAAHNNGQVYKTVNGTAASPSWTRVDLNGPLPARWVSCITIDDANADHVYVSFMGFAADNVWETTDGGATFHQVTGSPSRHIPSAPVSALALDPQRPGHLLAGTDIGIFTSWDNGATWSVVTDGPGTVPIDFFQWRNNSQLMAYTYGRGAWQGAVSPADAAVAPTGFSVFRGVLQSGGLNDVLLSDDRYLVVRNGLVLNPNESPVTVDFTGTAPSTVAQSITLKCEASASTGGLVRKLQAFNYDTNAWVEVDSRNAATADQVVTATITNNVSSFIEPTTRQIKMRYLLRVGVLAGSASWTANIDQVAWTVAQ